MIHRLVSRLYIYRNRADTEKLISQNLKTINIIISIIIECFRDHEDSQCRTKALQK